MVDALIVGAGPAGSIAAWRLAKAGARVVLVDRESFPRDKLCGDTLNPGAVALLRSLSLSGSPVEEARPLAGMLVTGPHTRIEARYQGGVSGRALRRRVLDDWLLSQAVAAGARFEPGVTVREAIVDTSHQRHVVRGVALSTRADSRHVIRMPAILTLAADGRSSTVARSVGLAWYPRAPRRWAFGTYASGVAGVGDVGEMHIRGRRYLGIAPLPDGICNVCLVTGPKPPGRTPLGVVRHAIDADRRLRERFGDARFEAGVTVLGPLAVETAACGMEGLLLAGDAAGFIDPMTGDGLHLALRGGLFAADEALAALETGDAWSAVGRLARARREFLGPKLRFNRVLRRLVESPAAVELAGLGAHVLPGVARWAIRHAGDAA